MGREWVTVRFAGPETRAETSLCRCCPRGETGCCSEPPPYSLAEIGRVAAAPGGEEWLRVEVAASRLIVRPEVLQPARWEGVCAYWRRGQGCILGRRLRPAQCNYFVCGEALRRSGLVPGTAYHEAGPAGGGGLDPVHRAHGSLLRLYARWHRVLLAALRRLELAPLQAAQIAPAVAVLACWWRVLAGQWRRVEPQLPGEGELHSEGA